MTARDQKRRMCVVGGVFGLVILALWGRLFQLQYLRHDEYSAAADRQHIAPREIDADRGGIFDRDGRPLAMNIRRCSLAVQPERIKDSRTVIRSLGKDAGVPSAVVRAALRGSRPFVYVKHDCVLDDETRRELAHIDGVVVEANASRIYPYDAVGSKVVGFVSRENHGLSGVELAYDDALRGTAGRVTVLRNGRYSSDRYYEYVDKKPIDGKHVYLTIDATIQDIAEAELRSAVSEFQARGGAVIVMDVPSGDVLALAESPSIPARDGLVDGGGQVVDHPGPRRVVVRRFTVDAALGVTRLRARFDLQAGDRGGAPGQGPSRPRGFFLRRRRACGSRVRRHQ